jgi:O-antigen ligase
MSRVDGEPVMQRIIAVLLVCHVVGFAFVSAVGDVLAVGPGASSVAYRGLVLGLSLLVIIAFFLGQVRFASSRAWSLCLVFWAALLARLLFDGFWRAIPLPRGIDEYLLISIGVCFIPMVAMFSAATASTLRLASSAAFAACLVTSCLLIWLLLTGGIVEWSLRLATETLNPISIGYVGAALVVMAAVHSPQDAAGGVVRLGLVQIARIGAYPLGMAVVFSSGSRGPLLAMVVAFLLRAILSAGSRSLGGVRVALVMLIAAALLSLGALTLSSIADNSLGPSVAERLGSVRDESTDLRLQAAAGAVAQFADSPVFGSSMLEQSTMDYPHNMVLESLIATGIFGAIVFVFFFLMVARAAVDLIRDARTQWLGMLCVLQLVATLTSGSLYLTDAFWTLGAATVAAASTKTVGVVSHYSRRNETSHFVRQY